MPDMEPLVHLEAASFCYDGAEEAAMAGVTLDVWPGECVCLVGPIGSGKSTTLALAAGLWPRWIKGRLDGRRVGPAIGDFTRHPRSAFLFQDADDNICASNVWDEIALALDSSSLSDDKARGRVREIVNEFGLAGIIEKATSNLSVGWRQWVALAAFFAAEPDLMFLDEPTANLDDNHRARLVELIRSHMGNNSFHAAVISTHDAELIDRLSARVISLVNQESPTIASLSPNKYRGETKGREILLGADAVTFSYRNGGRLIEDASLKVEEGDCVVIIGENGSGKSTLARLLAGLQQPQSGRIQCATLPRLRLPDPRLVGYVAQVPSTQLFGRTVSEELELTPRAVGSLTAVNDGKARFDVKFLERDPMSLSHGQRRLLQIAAFAGMPRVLIVDEPPNELGSYGEQLARAVDGYPGRGRALVVCTHEMRPWKACATSFLEVGRAESKQGEAPVQSLSEQCTAVDVLGVSSAHPAARGAFLFSLFLGLFSAPLVLPWFVVSIIGTFWTTCRRRLFHPMAWGPPLAVGVAALAGGWFSGAAWSDTWLSAAVGVTRMFLICSTGLVFPILFSERDLAFMSNKLGVPSFALSLYAAYRTLPLAMQTGRDIVWGLASRGLAPALRKPKTWPSAGARLLASLILVLLERAEALATVFEIRGLAVPGRFLSRPSSLARSNLLLTLAVVNVMILIGGLLLTL